MRNALVQRQFAKQQQFSGALGTSIHGSLERKVEAEWLVTGRARRDRSWPISATGKRAYRGVRFDIQWRAATADFLAALSSRRIDYRMR